MNLTSPVLAFLSLLQPSDINNNNSTRFGCSFLNKIPRDALEITKVRAIYEYYLEMNYFNPKAHKIPVSFVPKFKSDPIPFSESLHTMDIQRLIINTVTPKDRNFKSTNFGKILNDYYHCIPKKYRCNEKKIHCDSRKSGYRTLDGVCNNLIHPHYGSVNMRYESDDVVFNDGVDAFRLDVETNQPLISPRIICQHIRKSDEYEKQTNDCKIRLPNQLSLFFGQAFSHDIGSNQQVTGVGASPTLIECCSKDSKYEQSYATRSCQCVPIEVPSNDTYYGKKNVKCISYGRLEKIRPNDCTDTRPLLTKNRASSFCNLDIIYSTNEKTMRSLRTGYEGHIRLDKGIMPGAECNDNCCKFFFVGDPRANQTTQLASIHSMFSRSHNMFADLHRLKYPKLSDEELFNLARALNIDIFCSIIFNYWLPLFIDKYYLKKQGIMCPDSSFVGGCESIYDPEVLPSAEGETSLAAMRTFHQKIRNEQNFYDQNWKKISTLKLSETILNVGLLCTNYSSLIRGMIKDEIRTSFGYPEQLTDDLFGRLDLFSTDIMRGRDHGLQPYVIRYNRCTNKKIYGWDDLRPIFGTNRMKTMRDIYKNVYNIDLLTGLLAELPTFGLGGGPVFACLSAEQFKRLKYGDRFFYSHTNTVGNFTRTKEQIIEIQNFTPSRFICAINPEIGEIPKNAFKAFKHGDELIKCSVLPKFNISLF